MSLTLTVLGASASMPGPNDACSGYLVTSRNTRVLLDCGTGVVSALQEVMSPRDLDAIVISHFHPDHFIDLVPMRYGLRYGLSEPLLLQVYVQPGGIEYLQAVGTGLRGSRTYFSSTYRLGEYDPTSQLLIGDMKISFCRTTHDIPTFAMAVEAGGKRLVYTADTQESPELEGFALGADLLLSESTYPSTLESLPSGNHLTSRQAGELASRSQVGQLVLTHFWPGVERQKFMDDARAAYNRPIHLAEQGLTITL